MKIHPIGYFHVQDRLAEAPISFYILFLNRERHGSHPVIKVIEYIAARKRALTIPQFKLLLSRSKKCKRSKRQIGLGVLRGDEVTAHPGDGSTTTLSAGGAKEADKLAGVGAEGSDIVPLVVSVRARESLAARDGSVAVEREDLLDAIVVIWVDNRRDVEVGSASEAIETHLSEHAWSVRCTLGDGVPVANPAGREGLVGGGEAGDDELGNRFEASVLGEDDGSLGAVLVDEVD